VLEPLTDADPRVIGRYQLHGRLGVGGMGAVYLGTDQDRRAAAVKVVRPDLLGDPEFRDRFRREVAAARRVQGGCVARVLDADVDAPSPWMATEYVDGVSLQTAIAQRGSLGGPMVLGLAGGLANALVAIHGAGLVHRDLKPSNILLAWDGPKIIDFGIARALDGTSNTATGSLLGTVAWMAPEQLRGERVGPAADVFAWALCVAFAAQGRHAFPAEAPAATAIRMLSAQPDLADVPEHLVPLLVGALDRDPVMRPSARDLVSALAGTAVGGVADADATAPALIDEGWDAPTPPGLGSAQPTRAVRKADWAATAAGAPTAAQADRTRLVNRRGGVPRWPAAAGAGVLAVTVSAAVLVFGPFGLTGAEAPDDQRRVAAEGDAAQRVDPQAPATNRTPSTDPNAPASIGAPGDAAAPGAAATAPTATPGTAEPQAASSAPAAQAYPPSVAWQRWYNGADHASLTGNPGGGFWYEHTLGHLFATGEAPGTGPVYTCLAGNESFTSLAATCEGQQVAGQLGWMYASAPAELATRPIYRCTIGGDHFDSLAADCEGQTVEGLLGYVVVE
jgi:hypothetical protein